MEFEAVIGLEVHAQLLTRSKIFCGCSTAFGAPPNSQTCPVCLGLPGALPVLNREALGMAAKAGLALGCRINPSSIFARKHYFYPDLPKGYQISQYEEPLAVEGSVQVWTGLRTPQGNISGRQHRSFGVRRVHLEDDAGKSLHSAGPGSLVNLNRTGVPLIEIVSEPDFRTSQEAYDYLDHLRRVLLYLGICDGNMEEGSLRCDANVSIRPIGETRLGTKLEIKNLNSFRFLQKALDYEVARQIEAWRRGEGLRQETRLWDPEAERTFILRSKEEARDYRYFPDPDLPPAVLSADWLRLLRSEIPELPEDRRLRLVRDYGVEGEEALQLVQSKAFADYFEEAVEAEAPARQVLNWMIGDLTRCLKASERTIEESPVPALHLARLIRLLEDGVISGKIAKTVFEKMYHEGAAPDALIERDGLRQLDDPGTIEGIVGEVLAESSDKAEAYRQGKTGLLGFFVGQVMGRTRGRANPQLVNEILKRKLDA